MALEARILGPMSALADGLRSRILLLLDGRELTVTELCAVLRLPQSTLSRHLKTLADHGWVRSRREGTRRIYRIPAEGLDPTARHVWQLTRTHVATSPLARQDAVRLEEVLAAQRSRSREFFAGSAGSWDRLRDELFGSSFYLHAAAALIDPQWVVADLGCGTGRFAEVLAGAVRQVIAVDASEEMLEAARTRLAGYPGVDVRRGELESLPLDDASVDAAVAVLVLHHVAQPRAVLAEAHRVLRPGGRLMVVDMLPHDREQYRDEMGHVWLGFAEEETRRMLAECGFGGARIAALPSERQAKGPPLFSARASRAPDEGPNRKRTKESNR